MNSLESVHLVLFGGDDSEPVRVVVPAAEPPALTPLASDLQEIMQMVNNGLWCRDKTDDGQGHGCITGLVQRAVDLR